MEPSTTLMAILLTSLKRKEFPAKYFSILPNKTLLRLIEIVPSNISIRWYSL